MSELDDNKQLFRVEASELLVELEDALLELENNPEDQDLISRVFRAMHTIKGSGAMFGFDDIAEFTHDVETVYDMVRNGEIKITNELIDLSLKARDQIKTMLESSETGEELIDEENKQKIIKGFKGFIPGKDASAKPQEIIMGRVNTEFKTYRIRFIPSLDIFLNGTNPLYLIDEIKELGECKVTVYTDKIPELKDFTPVFCYLYWEILLTTKKDKEAIKEVFIFVEDECEIKIDIIDTETESTYDEIDEYKKVGEILTERGDLSPLELNKALGDQRMLGEILVGTGLLTEEKIESALEEQKTIRDLREKRKVQETVSSIRVSSDKLDKLVNLVGEIVIAQARLTQLANEKREPELLAISEEVERLTVELRDSTLNIRMLPIGTTFGKFKRLVRDLSKDLNKEVDLITVGAETELDKTVIETLNDPLVHLIRNSIDHGIESPAERAAVGKPAMGTVTLSAFQSGADVVIEIKDDGKGIEPGTILKKAISKGLISPDAELTKKEILALTLLPGFSTAEKITSVSGRGVGMDVVKKCIDSLRGAIGIDSIPGEGTTITLRLPLTLAIIEGLLVKTSDQYYVMPLFSVEECVELSKDDIQKANNRHLINVRGEIIPYIRLKEVFHSNTSSPEIEQIVVTRLDGQRVGFVVDEVIGEHQTVIKTLGRVYKSIRGISGATILGDGTVALIMDISQLYQEAEIEEKIKIDKSDK